MEKLKSKPWTARTFTGKMERNGNLKTPAHLTHAPVDQLEVVQVLDGQDNSGSVEPDLVVLKASRVEQDQLQIAIIHELHDVEKVVLGN